MEDNPRKVFYQLFGQGDTSKERKAILSETDSLLDYVMEEGAALKKRIGAADRARVSDYLDSVREVEQRVQRLATSKSSQMDLPNAPQGVPDQFGDHLDALFDLIALAWQANQTQVASMMIAKEVSMRTYPNLQITEAFHPLSHHANDPSKHRAADQHPELPHAGVRASSSRSCRRARWRRHDARPFDHPVRQRTSSNSDLHNNDPLPNAILGKGYGRIKGGQHLKYPQDTPHANLLLTLLERAGVSMSALGNSSGTFAEV
jgi:hypothetical protein